MTKKLQAVVALLAGCGSVHNTPDGGTDSSVDASSGKTVQVATTGDDANDGITAPVKTLKRAIGLAMTDGSITGILMAAGRYDAANGETFPYTVPGAITLSGPAGGGAILAGSGTEPGLTLATGTIDNLEFENFMVAIVSTATGHVSNARIRSSALALRGETTAVLTVDNLDITGPATGCATGIQLNGGAKLTADTVSSQTLGTAFDLKDQSSLSLNNGMTTGTASCTVGNFSIATSGTVTLTSSLVDGGYDGLLFKRTTPPAATTLTNVTVRNVTDDAIQGPDAQVTITGGEFSNNARAGLEVFGGTWSLTNVTLKSNGVMAIYLQLSQTPGVITMRGCSVIQNANGVYLFGQVTADLGTTAAAGGNTFQGNSQLGVQLDGNATGLVHAVGNTWNANIQAADAQGKYTVATVPGPVAVSNGNNFSIANNGSSLQR